MLEINSWCNNIELLQFIPGQAVSSLVTELLANPDNARVLTNYLIWRLIATFYPSKYRDDERRGEQCLKQTEDVFGPVSFKFN